MPRLVSLAMYAVDRDAVLAYWDGLRRHLAAAGFDDVAPLLGWPDDLYAHWLDPDLLLGQTCGYPLTNRLVDRVRYVATPRYAAPGCDGSLYRSLVLVRDDEPAVALAEMAGRRVAFNSSDSQSGYNSLRALVAPLATAGRFFGSAIETGGHRASIAAVRSGRADLAAVDAVTAALLARSAPDEMAGLRVLCVTDPAPSLPFVTSLATTDADVTRLRAALTASAADLTLAAARAALLLDGFDVLSSDAYAAIPAMQRRAEAYGYPVLA